MPWAAAPSWTGSSAPTSPRATSSTAPRSPAPTTRSRSTPGRSDRPSPDGLGDHRCPADHARADRLVGALVDEDERARLTVVLVGVHEQRLGGPELHPSDLVQAELVDALDAV